LEEIPMSIEATIERHITETLLHGSERRRIGWDEDLIASGLLDSVAVLQLIYFVEEQLGVPVQGSEMIPDNFRTINLTRSFVERKRKAAMSVA
jgi:acyl carrier protein